MGAAPIGGGRGLDRAVRRCAGGLHRRKLRPQRQCPGVLRAGTGAALDRYSESKFGYLSHILGFWRSFCTINRAVPASSESRFDVKSMIYVIGVSYSAEYAIKGIYENSIGRVTEWIRGKVRTPQDEYARAVLQDYAAFLYTIPWYKYPFGEKP